METTLHRQLKERYAAGEHESEVWVDGFRIDVRAGATLIEVQHSALSAIRDKIRTLLEAGHAVLVVKPLAARTQLVMECAETGTVQRERLSPKRGSRWDLFLELVNFTRVFPHPNLSLEVILCDIVERRVPSTRRRRFRRPHHRVLDRTLSEVVDTWRIESVADLQSVLPATLAAQFTTQDLALQADIPRWLAQKVAYCLKACGAIRDIGVKQRSRLYERIALLPRVRKPKPKPKGTGRARKAA